MKGNINYCKGPSFRPATCRGFYYTHNTLLITMDSQTATYLYHRLQRYARAVDETKDNFLNIAPFGRYPASAPYFERCGIRELFEALDDNDEAKGALMDEFSAIELRLMSLETERGSAYRRLLHDELSARLDVYSAAVCHANLGCQKALLESGPVSRDRIIVLIRELEKTHDLKEIKELLSTLDASLSQEGPEGIQDLFEGPLPDKTGIMSPDRTDLIEG